MKLTTLLITAALLNVSAAGLSQTVTFSGKNVALTRVFAEVEKQTGFVFIYAKNTLDGTRPVTIKVKNVPVETFLQKLLADQPVKFTIDYQTVLLSRKPPAPAPAGRQPDSGPDTDPRPLYDTLIDVKGGIYDENHTPVSGASVVIQKTGKGTTSNSAGVFEFKNVPRNTALLISSIGFETKTVLATDRTMIVYLKKSESKLDEVQIIAYGKTNARSSTGNVTRVSGEELRKQPNINPMMALEGKVPGLNISTIYSHPATPVKLEIRGRSSVNSEFPNDPLYVIDGVPMTVVDAPNSIRYMPGTSPGLIQGGLSLSGGLSPFFGMNAENIESIEILKDGDATAIYGSRGANGVVLITTRRPKPGKTSYNLKWEQAFTNVVRFPKMIDRDTYFSLRREAMRNSGIVPTALNAPDLMLWDTTRYIDWQREIYRPGSNTTLYAGMSGGDNKNTFSLSANFNTIRPGKKEANNNGTMGVNFNFGHKSLDNKFSMDFGFSHTYMYTDATRMPGGDWAPNAPPILDSSGKPNYAPYQGLSVQYPWTQLFQPSKSKAHASKVNASLRYELIDGLTIHSRIGFDYSGTKNGFFMPLRSLNPFQPGNTAMAMFSDTRAVGLFFEPNVVYQKYIGKGKLEVTAGVTASYNTTEVSNITAMGFDVDELIESVSAAALAQATDDYAIYKYNAVFGVVRYEWMNKYYINLNGRRDGSSRFGPGKQFGNFGSIGLGWRVSEENWWKKVMPSFISFFKLRGSYGVVGNDRVGDYQYISQWAGGFSTSERLYDYNGIRTYAPIHAVNQLFQWESSSKSELAAEFELAKRINMSVVWYRNISDNQLTNQPVPEYSGFRSVTTNSPTKVENTGWEIQLFATITQQKEFRWTANFNIGINRNKLLSYPNLERSRHASQYKIGRSLNTYDMYHFLGVNPLTGEYMFEDYNKDGKISAGNNIPGDPSNDKYVQMDLFPEFDGGFGTSLSYKGVSLYLQFSYKKELVQDPFLTGRIPGRMGAVYVPAEIIERTWRKPGDIASYAALSTQSPGPIHQSDGGYIDGSYIKLNNVSVSWNLPNKLLKRVGLNSASISINANNIYTFTRHRGVLRLGLDANSDPLLRTTAFVLNVNF